jgi:hypothetical protein
MIQNAATMSVKAMAPSSSNPPLGIADFARTSDRYGYESRQGQEFENDLCDFEGNHDGASLLSQTVPAIFE